MTNSTQWKLSREQFEHLKKTSRELRDSQLKLKTDNPFDMIETLAQARFSVEQNFIMYLELIQENEPS